MWKAFSLLLFVLLIQTSVCLSQESESQKLFPFDSGDKCGYINQKGEVIVAPQFDLCIGFNEGMAGVSLSNKYGYIDESGQLVIPLKFDGFYPESFVEGLAPVEIRNASGGTDLGYVDKIGNLKILRGISEIGHFSEGLAEVKKNGKSGYIDKNFRFVIPPKYDVAWTFSEGRAYVSRSGRGYYIDKSGRKVINGRDSDHGSSFSEGLALFRSKYYGYGYMDINGKTVLEPHPNYYCPFKEGMACAEIDGKWGYIDKTGNFVISPKFDEAEDFSSDGVAVVKIDESYGFIDKKGEFIISQKFEKAEWLAGLGLVEINGVKKYVDRKGQTIFTWFSSSLEVYGLH